MMKGLIRETDENITHNKNFQLGWMKMRSLTAFVTRYWAKWMHITLANVEQAGVDLHEVSSSKLLVTSPLITG